MPPPRGLCWEEDTATPDSEGGMGSQTQATKLQLLPESPYNDTISLGIQEQ